MPIPAVVITWHVNPDGSATATWPADADPNIDEYIVGVDGGPTYITKSLSVGPLPGKVAHTVIVTPTAGDAQTAQATYTPTSSGLKSPIQGLIDRQGMPKLSIVKAMVVDCDWAVLQPVAGGPLATGTVLDKALQTGNQVKLRASRAGGAPPNAKALGGGPWTITNPASGQTATIGPYWSTPYLDWYADCQNKVGQKYDGAVTLLENVMAEPASVFDEPFIEPGVSTLPGWTLAADEAAFTAMLSIHKAAWATTHQDLAFNPFTAGPTSFTEQVLAEADALFGKQLVAGNNSLRDADLGALYDAVFAAIKARGGPTYFQTAQMSKGVTGATYTKAIGYGANSVELPGGYATAYTAPELAAWDAGLRANPV